MKMGKAKLILPLVAVFVLGIVVQVVLFFADCQQTPGRAASEFVKAFFAYDQAKMASRLCQESLVIDDVDVLGNYVYEATQAANERGYAMGCYMKNVLAHLQTETQSDGQAKAKVKVTALAKNGLRSFFTSEAPTHVEATLELVKDKNGLWKVCGNPFQALVGVH